MYFSVYSWDGDPAELEAAYRRMLTGFPVEAIQLQLAVARPDGLDVYDTCPTKEQFEAFAAGDDFRAACRSVGLGDPRLSGLGEIVHTVVREPVA